MVTLQTVTQTQSPYVILDDSFVTCQGCGEKLGDLIDFCEDIKPHKILSVCLSGFQRIFVLNVSNRSSFERGGRVSGHSKPFTQFTHNAVGCLTGRLWVLPAPSVQNLAPSQTHQRLLKVYPVIFFPFHVSQILEMRELFLRLIK